MILCISGNDFLNIPIIVLVIICVCLEGCYKFFKEKMEAENCVFYGSQDCFLCLGRLLKLIAGQSVYTYWVGKKSGDWTHPQP